MRYIFIINGREDKSFISERLKPQLEALEGQIEYDLYVTKSPMDATRYVSVYSDLHEDADVCFVACGGDGTINEVASGLVGADSHKCMAVMAYGTGNDFVKYYKGRDFNDVAKLLGGKMQEIDIMRINQRYSINVCNFGFDSIVATTANRLSVKGVKQPFRRGIAAAIFTGRYNHIRVIADGQPLNKKTLLLCTLSNCRYVGGEFFCAPRAFNDDGIIDVCMITPMPLIKFLQLMPLYRKGEHLDCVECSKNVHYYRARQVEIVSEKPTEVCIDGEMIPGKTFRVSIMPKAIRFIVPQA